MRYERRNEFALDDLGLAMKRYPELELVLVFNRIGVNITAARSQLPLLIRVACHLLSEATCREVSFADAANLEGTPRTAVVGAGFYVEQVQTSSRLAFSSQGRNVSLKP